MIPIKTSTDLWNWQHHPIAIAHDEKWGIWSGSAVIDTINTSGFFAEGQTNGVVAIYTQAHLTEGWQEQAIAYSLDGGYTFEKYSGNPVLAIGSTEFRDPKVIWHAETGKWVMVVAYSAEGKLGFYISSNLKEWTWVSTFTSPDLPRGSNFECPMLARIPWGSTNSQKFMGEGNESWILLASSGSGNPIWKGDGSVTRYFPGHFNGTHFCAIDDRADRVIDLGPDNYATAVFYDTPEDEAMITLGWATNLAYAGDQPSGPREGWRGILTSVRSAELRQGDDGEIRYHSFPVNLHEVNKTRLGSFALSTDASEDITFQMPASSAVLVDAQVKHLDTQKVHKGYSGSSLDIIFKASKSRESMMCSLVFRGSHAPPSFACERGNVLGGWTGRPAENMRVMGMQEVPRYDAMDSVWAVTAILDHSILEVFLNQGIAAGTFTVFPTEELDTVQIRSKGMENKFEVKVDVHGLHPN
jgi:beta-fructofuranosidase